MMKTVGDIHETYKLMILLLKIKIRLEIDRIIAFWVKISGWRFGHTSLTLLLSYSPRSSFTGNNKRSL